MERRGDTGKVRLPAEDATAGREEGQAVGGATTEELASGTATGAAPTDTKKIFKYERFDPFYDNRLRDLLRDHLRGFILCFFFSLLQCGSYHVPM